MKDLEKYIGYYLLVYVIVLFIAAFFQYFTVCQGKSLSDSRHPIRILRS